MWEFPTPLYGRKDRGRSHKAGLPCSRQMGCSCVTLSLTCESRRPGRLQPAPSAGTAWALRRGPAVLYSGACKTGLAGPLLQEGSAVPTQTCPPRTAGPGLEEGVGPQGALARDQGCSNTWGLQAHHAQGRTPKAIFGFAWTL